MPVPIRALDEIRAPYTPERVWAVLSDFASYPRWWPRGVGARVLETGVAEGGVGTNLEIRPFGGPGFQCRVEELEPPRRIGMSYHHGMVRGAAEWILEPISAGTRVGYRVDVAGEGPLVEVVGRLVDLASIHSWQMRGVLRGLQRELAARDRIPRR